MLNIITRVLGINHTREVNKIKNEMNTESEKTVILIRKMNKILVKKTRTYFIAKAMGII